MKLRFFARLFMISGLIIAGWAGHCGVALSSTPMATAHHTISADESNPPVSDGTAQTST